jgi:C4-dicarboxylate-binding protein DctP
LPADIRSELEAIIAEVTAEVNDRAETIDQEAREKVLASGETTLIEPNDEELAAWRKAMRPVWDEFAEQIGADIMAATPAGKTSL